MVAIIYWRFMRIVAGIFFLFVVGICLQSCLHFRYIPKDKDTICTIFKENKKWYKSAYASCKKWGVPIPVLMSIMYHESRFKANARPPRKSCLFIFPGFRLSSAYGYSQAIDRTWEQYKKDTSNRGAKRDNFDDAVDFIGWYCNLSFFTCSIKKNDAFNLYLAYHEGQKGFLRKTYRRKKWLISVAGKVRKKANLYSKQLSTCETYLIKSEGSCFMTLW